MTMTSQIRYLFETLVFLEKYKFVKEGDNHNKIMLVYELPFLLEYKFYHYNVLFKLHRGNAFDMIEWNHLQKILWCFEFICNFMDLVNVCLI